MALNLDEYKDPARDKSLKDVWYTCRTVDDAHLKAETEIIKNVERQLRKLLRANKLTREEFEAMRRDLRQKVTASQNASIQTIKTKVTYPFREKLTKAHARLMRSQDRVRELRAQLEERKGP
jgi:chemotaxis methyl-accepting protein methylase